MQDSTLSFSKVVGSISAAQVFTQTARVAIFESVPIDVVGENNDQVVTTIHSNHSKRIGNIVHLSLDLTLDMAVDFDSYPLTVARIDPALAPPNTAFLITCLEFPPNPTPGVYVLQVFPDGIIQNCVTGLPFPAGVYTFRSSTMYII